jgi:hypothetical protein
MTEPIRNKNRPVVRLKNPRCPYCGKELSPEIRSDDHLIGRCFVPKGSLNNIWNLFLNACKDCNGIKSDLENDISAITMQPDCFGQSPDELIRQEAMRKGAGSYSRRTRKPVAESAESITIVKNVGPATITFALVSPPQVDDRRVAELAWFHVIACMYWLSFDETKQEGARFDEVFAPLSMAPRSDWGNDLQIAFMRTVATWEERLIGIAASGYFKVAIRKLTDVRCWSWALEWNQSMRVIGLLGEPAAATTVQQDLPSLPLHAVGKSNDGSRLSFRPEKPLAHSDDLMFA